MCASRKKAPIARRYKQLTGLALLTAVGLLAPDLFPSSCSLRGRVTDQHGTALPDATVSYTRMSLLTLPPTQVQTNANGEFKIRCFRRLGYMVAARKPGYTELSDWGNGLPSSMRSLISITPLPPQIELTLLDKGEIEPLVSRKSGYQPLRSDGKPLQLVIGQDEETHSVEFMQETGPKGTAALPESGEIPFTWKMTLKAPHGEVAPRKWVDFLAPEKAWLKEGSVGYDEHPATDRWRDSENGDYYLKFDDGTYARITFTVRAELMGDGNRGKECLYLDSWYNPKKNSRQLSPE